MLYESHVTVLDPYDTWFDLCRSLAIKPLHIELDSGEHPLQRMCAVVHDGSLDRAKAITAGIEAAARGACCQVIRTKLETPLDKASDHLHYVYHEAHIKMLLHPDEAAKLPALADLAKLHLSRNLLLADVDGFEKWYLTARSYDGDFRLAAKRFAAAFATITKFLPGVRMEMESVLSDTAPELDKGWAQ